MERARFIYRGTTPAIGWIYEIEHEGETFKFQAAMYAELVRQLRAWHLAKKVEWPGDAEMLARVEHYICMRSPKGFCKGGEGYVPARILSSKGIRDATRGFAYKAIRNPDLLVPMDEAERRAKTCANCKMNLHGICTSCAGNEFMDIFAMYERAGRTTPYDSVLDTCDACSCLLKVKVHISIDLLALTPKYRYPDNCWLSGTPADLPKATADEKRPE